MSLNDVKEFLVENGCDEAIVFENPDYADAFIGSSSDNRAVYSFSKMVDCLMKDDSMNVDEATDFIEYNTMRAIPYFGPNSPIIVYDF